MPDNGSVMIAQQLEPIQIVSMLVIVATLIFLYLQCEEDSKVRNWVVPMFVWMGHGLVYYLVLFANRAQIFEALPFGFTYTTWSSILRFHGYITVLMVEITRWYLHREKNNLFTSLGFLGWFRGGRIQ